MLLVILYYYQISSPLKKKCLSNRYVTKIFLDEITPFLAKLQKNEYLKRYYMIFM